MGAHAFSAIVQLFIFGVREYGGRRVILAMFRHDVSFPVHRIMQRSYDDKRAIRITARRHEVTYGNAAQGTEVSRDSH
jgi:hypothetical protein